MLASMLLSGFIAVATITFSLELLVLELLSSSSLCRRFDLAGVISTTSSLTEGAYSRSARLVGLRIALPMLFSAYPLPTLRDELVSVVPALSLDVTQ